MRLSSIVTGLVLLAPSLASAEREVQIGGTGIAQVGDIVGGAPDINGLVFARQVVPASAGNPATTGANGTIAALAQSKVVYLNKNGITLSPGTNDSRSNRSSLAQSSVAIPAWSTTPAIWAETVACMKNLFAPFDVTITDTNPGSVAHIEAVFGGSPTLLGMASNVGGVSPFTTDCSVIENSIVFTFTAVLPQDARLACEIMAQEVAHSYGLDHELLASDPMTYLNYTGNRSFKNMTAPCGEDVTRVCGLPGYNCRANQNSVAMLNQRLGPAGGGGADLVPPTVGISSPGDNSTVPPGFEVKATANDNIAVSTVTLYVDGTETDSQATGPFVFTTASTLSEGVHQIRIEATDGTNVQSSEITVTIKKGAPPPGGGGAGNDDGNVSGDVTGGCSTGGSLSLGLGLAVAGLIRRRRR